MTFPCLITLLDIYDIQEFLPFFNVYKRQEIPALYFQPQLVMYIYISQVHTTPALHLLILWCTLCSAILFSTHSGSKICYDKYKIKFHYMKTKITNYPISYYCEFGSFSKNKFKFLIIQYMWWFKYRMAHSTWERVWSTGTGLDSGSLDLEFEPR